MLGQLAPYLERPTLYAQSSHKFWDDAHISKGMLAEHLNPASDGATRNHQFVARSAAWIAEQFTPKNYPILLDLGCGPGIYAEKFAIAGYDVTGIDLSVRSIDYAQQHIESKPYQATYVCRNYLTLDDEDAFDIITLIWCDYGVLPPEDRSTLLKNIYRALKDGGVLIFDVFTTQRYASIEEQKHYAYFPTEGFWHPEEHLCLHATFRFDGNITLNQAIVVTNDAPRCYNIWERYFTQTELQEELKQAGFAHIDFYGDVAGATCQAESHTLCAVAHKKRRRK